MIALLPAQTPGFSALVGDIGGPHPDRLASALQVSRRTVYRWLAHDDAPHMACLALWPLTRYGRSALESDALQREAIAFATARAHEREANTLRARVAYLERIGAHGAANDGLATATAAVFALDQPLQRWR